MKIYIIEFSNKYMTELTASKVAAEERMKKIREFLDSQEEQHITLRLRAVELKTQGKNYYSIAQQTKL